MRIFGMCVFGKKTKILINSEIFCCVKIETKRRIKTVNDENWNKKKGKERSTNKLRTDCVLRKENAMQKSRGNKIQKEQREEEEEEQGKVLELDEEEGGNEKAEMQ